jgi:hypothetical protein
MTYDDRVRPGQLHELAVMERLRQAGWIAEPFGQGQLSDPFRRLLKQFETTAHQPTLIRWLADIIAGREVGTDRSSVVLVDAKCCNGRPNYAIELSAIETAEVFCNQLYTPTVYVFDDFHCLTPREARQRGRQGNDPAPGNGSGTPYVLIDKRWGHAFDEFFPAVPART